MIKRLILLTCLALSGCFYQVAHNGDIQAAQTLCERRGGINHLSIAFSGDEVIECQDGFRAHVSEVQAGSKR